MAGGGTPQAQSEKGSPSLAPPWGPSAPRARGDTHHGEINGRGSPQHLTEGILPGGTGHITKRWGRAPWDCMGLTMGCTGEEAKVGKGTDQGGWRRIRMGKQRDKGSWFVPLSGCVLLQIPTVCPVLLLNCTSLFLGKRLSVLCACVPATGPDHW